MSLFAGNLRLLLHPRGGSDSQKYTSYFLFRDYLIKVVQLSLQYPRHSLDSCDLVKQYDSWLAGTRHLIAGKVVTLWNTNEPFPTEPCATSGGILVSHHNFVDSAEVFSFFGTSSHVLLRCPRRVLNGEWRSALDFGQHFTRCVFREARAPAREEKQEYFSLKVLPLISNWDWIRLD